jgi:hypothetical protein
MRTRTDTLPQQQILPLNGNGADPFLIPTIEPYYTTALGAAYLGDSLE